MSSPVDGSTRMLRPNGIESIPRQIQTTAKSNRRHDHFMNETVTKHDSRWKRIFGQIILWLCLVAIMIGLLAFFGRYSFFGELVGNFRMQIAVVIFLLGALLTYTQFRLWSALPIVVGIAVLFPIAWTFLPAQQTAPGPVSVSLLSYNILGHNEDREPVLETIWNHSADILVLLEYNNSWADAIEKNTSFYPYSIKHPSNTGYGIAVFSKFPFTNPTVEKSTEADDIPIVLSEIKIAQQSVLLAAVHLLSPTSPERMVVRNDQMATVTRLIEKYQQGRDLPVILVGDFNAVAWSPFVGDMLSHLNLRDTREGYFYQGSWPTFNWLLRIPIDNAFVSRQIHIGQRNLLPVTSSDHFPLYLEFSVSENSPPAAE